MKTYSTSSSCYKETFLVCLHSQYKLCWSQVVWKYRISKPTKCCLCFVATPPQKKEKKTPQHASQLSFNKELGVTCCPKYIIFSNSSLKVLIWENSSLSSFILRGSVSQQSLLLWYSIRHTEKKRKIKGNRWFWISASVSLSSPFLSVLLRLKELQNHPCLDDYILCRTLLLVALFNRFNSMSLHHIFQFFKL